MIDREIVEFVAGMVLIGVIALLAVWAFAGYLYWRSRQQRTTHSPEGRRTPIVPKDGDHTIPVP